MDLAQQRQPEHHEKHRENQVGDGERTGENADDGEAEKTEEDADRRIDGRQAQDEARREP